MMGGMVWDVDVLRDEPGWMATVIGLEGAYTWAHTLEELRAHVQDVIRLIAELPDSEAVEFRYTDPDLEHSRTT